MPQAYRFDARRRLVLAFAWALLWLGLCGGQWWQSHAQRQRQQMQSAEAVQRQLLEKTAQHSAHLTSLAALIGLPAALQQVAQSIQTFYPRIEHIALIGPAQASEGNAAGDSCRQTAAARIAAPLRPGESSSLPDSQVPGRYLLIKKVAAPAGWLCMRIDSGQLLEPQSPSNPVRVRIQLHGQTLQAVPAGAATAAATAAAFASFGLPGYGQPLQITLFDARAATPWQDWPRMLLYALLSLVLVLLAGQVWKNRLQALRHQQREQLLANEARLAHAARVNSLGEMASGIAHELAQPVTALLSQSQAALRAQETGKSELLAMALQANVSEARRAGAILGRIRSHISNTPSQPQALPLGQAVTQALLLLEGPARQAGARLQWQPPADDCIVLADPVALEQVLHNLVRNAFEAMAAAATPEPQVSITLERQAAYGLLAVQDNGPGIAAAAARHVFEPFYTTKPDGLGLGLPLCATLMERMGGQLEHVARAASPGACFVLRLPRPTHAKDPA